MRLAAERGWAELRLSEIAVAAGMTLAQLYALVPSKAAVLTTLAAQVDRTVLNDVGEPVPGDSRRDRLFDIVMSRFEALAPYKPGLTVIARESRHSPADVICVVPALLRSMRWMLEAAGVPSGGLRGLARTNALAIVYGRTFSAWLKDDSPDMAPTMAALDRALTRAERLL